MRRDLTVDRERSLLATLMRSTPAHVEALRLPEEAWSQVPMAETYSAVLRAVELVRANPTRWGGRLNPKLVETVLRDHGAKWLSDPEAREPIFAAPETIEDRTIWADMQRRLGCSIVRQRAATLAAVAASGDHAVMLAELDALRAWTPPSVEPGRRDYSFSARQLAESTLEFMKAQGERARVDVPMLGEALASVVPGSLCVIGGDTNTGKSGLMLFLAMAYQRAGRKVGVISLEDPKHVWGDRLQASLSGVSLLSAVRRGWNPSREEWADVGDAIQRLADVDIAVSVLPKTDLELVVDEFRALALDGCEVIFVDYVQEITDEALADERRLLITKAASSLKSEAQERGVMLFLGSQLSRTAEHRRKGNEPNARALKESGELENKSEMIVLLWRETDETNAPTLGKVAKNKSSDQRPRFQVVRNQAGSIVDLVEHNPTASSAFADGSAGERRASFRSGR